MNYKQDISFRKKTLIKLLNVIQNHEDDITKALYQDFKKSEFETYLSETNFIYSELKNTVKNIDKWAKSKTVFPSLLNFPSTDKIYKEPYGKALIIAPWNYPFQLVFSPLIAAIAAGNQVIVKPSELTPHTSALVKKIVEEVFDKNHVEVIEGGIEVSQKLLAQRWDYIFFTGSVAVGKIVAKAAAEHLTPVTLELGGKNPCIVDKSADLKLAAKRIVWGKFLNAGQTCIAPDYILVDKQVKEIFIELLKQEIVATYSDNIETNEDYPRIINAKNWQRLVNLLQGKKILFGGISNNHDCYLSPTLIDEPSLDSTIMQEEIFGPILPILSYQKINEIENIISTFEKPLSLYVFSGNREFAQHCITNFSFGGGCINDTLIHFANNKLPFGGVGHSGIGAYHGKLSFDTFSHHKSVVKKATWLDIPLRYAPYKGKLNVLKKILKWL